MDFDNNLISINEGGNVGIGTASPDNRLSIVGGTDVALGGGGYLTLGAETAANISIDNNEIMARNNGVGAILYLQNDSGSGNTIVNQVSGNVGIGSSDADNQLTVTGLGDVSGVNAGGGVLLQDSTGDATGWKLRIDANELQVSQGGAANSFTINPFGGSIGLGSTSVQQDVNINMARLDFSYATTGDIIAFENDATAFIEKESDRGGTRIGKDDAIVLGSGESSVTTAANVNMDAEETYLVSDNDVYIFADLQSGWSNRKEFRFDDNGNAYKSGGGSWTATSDARLKNVEAPYQSGLSAIIGLKPVRYRYREGNIRGEPTDKQFIGLVAQQAMEAMPELVSLREEDGYYDLDPSAISFALVNAVKELKAANDNLRELVEEQGRQIERLKAAQ